MAFNILIADDSVTMRQVIKKVVKMSGVAVGEFYEAENGQKALQVLEREWIDVILSDINMPEMDGMMFLRQVKEHEVYKTIPVIFITTEASEARMEEAKALGVAGYVKKPFQPETIKEKLYGVLEEAYAQRMGEVSANEPQEDEDMDF